MEDDRVCACGCGRSLRGRSRKARFYSDACRARGRIHKPVARSPRKPLRTWLVRPFLALDGEARQDRYVLLAGARADGWYDYVQSGAGLDTETCLEFLLDLTPPLRTKSHCTPSWKPILVWFAMDYDVNMMLKDVPFRGKNSIEQLYQDGEINWRGYRIRYIRRKIFRVARGNRRHSSYDIWGFFQSSFERSLEKWGIESSSVIQEGKASRAGFASWTLTRIREYNKEELIQLATLAGKLRDAVAPLDIPVQSWHGPAALAGSWLRKHKAKDFLSSTPDRMLDPVTRAYFGGRIDIAGYGYVDPVYHYDIVSAYPSAIRNLPDLKRLKWIRKRKGTPKGIYLGHVHWRLPIQIPKRIWTPFPWRDKHGTILWPSEGEAWIWFPEIEAAREKFSDAQIELEEWFESEGEITYPFYDLINESFKHRAKLKAEGNPAHVPLKLILNSLYGKFAQTVGSARYHSLIWAGLITSQTRSQILRAITDDVVCVMTDSLWSRKPLPLPLGSSLGEWEEQDDTRLWLAEAGLYEAETPDGNTWVWQRGFDKRNPVDIRRIVQEWTHGDELYTATYKVHRFIGMGLALQTHYPWAHWVDIERKVSPVPYSGTSKRFPLYPLSEYDSPLSDGFQTLATRERDEKVCSYPYNKVTLDPDLLLRSLEDETSEFE